MKCSIGLADERIETAIVSDTPSGSENGTSEENELERPLGIRKSSRARTATQKVNDWTSEQTKQKPVKLKGQQTLKPEKKKKNPKAEDIAKLLDQRTIDGRDEFLAYLKGVPNLTCPCNEFLRLAAPTRRVCHRTSA